MNYIYIIIILGSIYTDNLPDNAGPVLFVGADKPSIPRLLVVLILFY